MSATNISRQPEPSRPQAADRPAEHVAAMAWLLVELGANGSSVSTQLPVDIEEAAAIRRFLPALAARHGLLATIGEDGGCVTVVFERPPR